MDVLDPSAMMGKVKPTMFPRQLPLIESKKLDLASYGAVSDDTESTSFKTTMANTEKTMPRLSNTPRNTDTPVASTLENDTRLAAVRSIGKLYEGFAFVPQDVLAKVDQLKESANYEKVKDPNYVYLPNLIPSSSPTDHSIEAEVYDHKFLEWVAENPGERATSPHNLNLLHGMDTNPFKEGDTENFTLFQSSPYFKALHNQSMTPRNIIQKLDPMFWKTINQTIDDIANTNLDQLPASVLKQLKNPYGRETASLSIKNVEDPFTDSGTDQFDIHANFSGILESNIWQSWKEPTTFRFVNRLWEASTRVDDVLREIFGNATDMPSSKYEKSLIDKTDKASIEAMQTMRQRVIGRVTQWWDHVGQHLDLTTLLPFGLLSALAPLMATTKDLGNFTDSTSLSTEGDTLGFKDKIISDYLTELKRDYLTKRFKSKKQLDPDQFSQLSPTQLKGLMKSLDNGKQLDALGRVGEGFDANQVDIKGLGLPNDVAEDIQNTLKEYQIGTFSLEVQDQTRINGRRRTDIKIQAADGTFVTLPALLNLLATGDTPKAQIENAQMVYNTVLGLYKELSGLSTRSHTDGTIVASSKTGEIKRNVANMATWQEWDGDTLSWKPNRGPLSITFSRAADANQFGDQLRILVALLEPIVGLFGQRFTENGQPTFVQLVDNSGTSHAKEIIMDGSPAYQLRLDAIYDRSIFETSFWKDASELLETKVTMRLGEGLFTRSVMNQLERSSHRTKKVDYDKAVEEVKEDEARRLLQEMRDRIKKRQAESEQIKIRKEAQAQQQIDEKKRKALSDKLAKEEKKAKRS